MATHTIPLERRTLHGTFSREREPILTVEPGDRVQFSTLMAGWDVTPGHEFEPRDPELDRGHALIGPIAMRGAEPGMTLEVRVNALRPAEWGVTTAGGWHTAINDRLGIGEGEKLRHEWTLDREAWVGRNQHGHTVKLRPFLGVMGMPPDEAGVHSTAPPRVTGGNIDCKELVADSSLFLPIAVPLGLFSAGDGHAVQGDGEVSWTALECGMELVDLTLRLHPELHLATPRAITPAGRITLGFSTDLHEAALIALEAMLDWMGELYGIQRRDALALASLTVDLRVTQLVNDGMLGVHAVLPDGVISGLHSVS